MHGLLFYAVTDRLLIDVEDYILIMDGFAIQGGQLKFTSRFLNANEDSKLATIYHDKQIDVLVCTSPVCTPTVLLCYFFLLLCSFLVTTAFLFILSFFL